jgi:hypothetical protein
MLSLVMLSVIFYLLFILNVIMMSVIFTSVVMLNVVMLSVVGQQTQYARYYMLDLALHLVPLVMHVKLFYECPYRPGASLM